MTNNGQVSQLNIFFNCKIGINIDLSLSMYQLLLEKSEE